MKKTYISPDMEVVKIETAQMLAASARSLDGGSEGGFSERTGSGLPAPACYHKR